MAPDHDELNIQTKRIITSKDNDNDNARKKWNQGKGHERYVNSSIFVFYICFGNLSNEMKHNQQDCL